MGYLNKDELCRQAKRKERFNAWIFGAIGFVLPLLIFSDIPVYFPTHLLIGLGLGILLFLTYVVVKCAK